MVDDCAPIATFMCLADPMQGPTTVTQTVTTTHFTASPPPKSRRPEPTSAHAPSGNATIRPVNESMTPKPLKPNSKKQATVRSFDEQPYAPSSDASHVNDSPVHRQQSIPRKQMAPSSAEPVHTPNPTERSPYIKTKGGQPYGGSDILPVQKATWSPESQQASNASPRNLVHTMREREESRGQFSATSAANAQDVLDRARNNTVETQVTESVAPGAIALKTPSTLTWLNKH